MSELLLRGYNPAKSYLEDGADLILEDGRRIEVKSAHASEPCRTNRPYGKGHYISRYYFSFRGGHRKHQQDLNGKCDFIILWGIDTNNFYIIPKGEIPKHGIGIPVNSQSTQWLKYKDNWEMLNRR